MEIADALTRFALSLEDQLPGLQLVHLVDDSAALRRFLPTLTSFLRRQRVLIVLDNVESLLTDSGGWRDERWAALVGALTGHDGLGRLILTSRRPPTGLPNQVLVERVHALSVTEAVLLAREWPHLRTLLDGTHPALAADEARQLAARTLAVVQGHPKLIELADGQASDPTRLQARLAEAEARWLTAGTRVAEFFSTGESAVSAADYLQVLQAWTRSATADLPAASRLLFDLLCCLQPDDRLPPVVAGTWAHLWRLALPGDPPPPDQGLPLLEERTLVAVSRDQDNQPVGYRMHPAVADTGRRDTGADLQAAVDAELAAFWLAIFQHGKEQEQQGASGLVLYAARSALPYLLRTQDWEAFHDTAAAVLTRDARPETVAELLPLLRHARTVTSGSSVERYMIFLLALALSTSRLDQADDLFRQARDTYLAAGDYEGAGAVAAQWVNLLQDAGRFDDALTLVRQRREDDRRAGLGPWTQLAGEEQELQILALQGHSQQVLDRVTALRPTLRTLPDQSNQPEVVAPWHVREFLLDTGRMAARRLGKWEEALALIAEQLDLMRRRGATDLDIASTRFNAYAPLLRLGRVAEARTLLLDCRRIFDQASDIPKLGMTLSGLAEVEYQLGHVDQAVGLERNVLRLTYRSSDPDGIAVSHHNLSSYLLESAGPSAEQMAHLLAAAVIRYQIGSGAISSSLPALARALEQAGDGLVPDSFKQVCALVGRTEGVRLADLLTRLPRRAPDGQAAVEEVLHLARHLPAEQVYDLEGTLARWEPVLSALLAAHRGNPDAAQLLAPWLDQLASSSDWKDLATVLRRILAGDRGDKLLVGLDRTGTAIAQRALDALTGRVQLTASYDRLRPTIPDAWERVIIAVVAAASGDTQAARLLAPWLDQLASSSDWKDLATVLRRILAGDRGDKLLVGLDRTGTAIASEVLHRLRASASRP